MTDHETTPIIIPSGPQSDQRRPALGLSLTTLITVGHRGYGVIVDDAQSEARVVRSARDEVRSVASFPFAEVGKDSAIGVACVTAYKLDQTAGVAERA